MRFYFLLFLFSLIQEAHSQSISPDSTQILEKMVLQADYLREKNFKAAEIPMDWLIANVPNWSISLYINAEKIYKGRLAENPEDQLIQNKLLNSFDTRMKHFGNWQEVLKRKSYWAYKFWVNKPMRFNELKNMLETTFNVNQGNVPETLFLARMDLLRRMKKKELVEDSAIIGDYNEMLTYLDQYYPTNEKTEKLMTHLLTETVKFNCQELEDLLFQKLKDTPTNANLAKLILMLGLSQKCTDSQFFIETLKRLVLIEPNYGLTKYLAILYENQGDEKLALETCKQALDLAITTSERYEVYMLMAKLHQKLRQWEPARKAALLASINSDQIEPFELIGDLYMTSLDECRKGESRVEDRAIYWVAYDQYSKAGNIEKMNLAEQRFPSITELFNELVKENTAYKVGCWIQEKTIVRRRPTDGN